VRKKKALGLTGLAIHQFTTPLSIVSDQDLIDPDQILIETLVPCARRTEDMKQSTTKNDAAVAPVDETSDPILSTPNGEGSWNSSNLNTLQGKEMEYVTYNGYSRARIPPN